MKNRLLIDFAIIDINKSFIKSPLVIRSTYYACKRYLYKSRYQYMQYLVEVILSASNSINVAYNPCRAKTLNYIIKIYGKISSDLSFKGNIALPFTSIQVQYSITEVSNNMLLQEKLE